MCPQALVEIVELVSDPNYIFELSNITHVQKLFSSKKQTVLLLTQQEYACLQKLLEGASKSALKAEIKKKYSDWFSQQCFVNGLITTAFYQQCVKKSILRDVFFDFSNDYYSAVYHLKFTANKISFLVNNCRKEIDADALLHQYNENAKKSGLAQRVVLTDLFQFQNPAEIACFKQTMSSFVEKSEIVQAKWRLPSNQKNVSSALVFNKNEQKFFIQKNGANIELNPDGFLNDFKKQYRKERPWYGSVSEWLGFGVLSQLKKKSTDADRIEYLFEHAGKSSDSTTGKTLESLFQSANFLEDFKKQYRKERPWYGFLTEKMGAGTLGKLNGTEKNTIHFLKEYGKIKSGTTTAKTLDSMKQFAIYRSGELPPEKISSLAEDRKNPISSDRLSVNAMIKRQHFSRERADLEKKGREAHEALVSNLSVEFQHGFERIDEQEKIERLQKQKQIARGNLLRSLENSLTPFWVSASQDERNLNAGQKKYFEANNFGVRKIQYHLYFNEKEIASLAAFAADEESIKIYQWIQSIRVLYDKFGMVRNSLENPRLSDEAIQNRVNEFVCTVNELTEKEYLDKNVFKNLSRACALYQVAIEDLKAISVPFRQNSFSHL